MNNREWRFMEVLSLLERLSVARQDGAEITVGQVKRWAGMKPATAYRIAKKLIRIKVVTYQEFLYKGKPAKDLRLTKTGRELLIKRVECL